MRTMKRTLLAVAAATALICLPVAPAVAAGPLLFAPMVLGHVLGAMARLATLPLLAASQIPAPAYPPPQQGYYPGYYAGAQPTYGAAPGYYSGPQPTYGAAPAYYGAPQPYYGAARPSYQPYYPSPPAYYGYRPPQYYAPPRRDYVPYARYAGAYGPPVARPYGGAVYRYGGSGYRSGGYAYRHR